jgi:adenosine deaminase
MSAITLELLEKLPKTDLHCHLDGSIRLKTILELAEQQKVKLPATTEDGLYKLIYPGEACSSLEDYLKAFDITLAVMQTEESLYRTAFELGEDAARENVRLLEVRYAPMLHMKQGLKLTQIVEAVLAGLREAKRKYRIRYGVILCGIRSISAEWSLRMAELCVAYKNRGVVGFDLAGAEYNFPAKDHKEAFQLILNNNVNCTAHAGDAYGPESIAQAIHYCGAHRIGHGTRLVEDMVVYEDKVISLGPLAQYVLDHRTPIEVCLSSNVHTGAAASLEKHPFPHYFRKGFRVTLNTDNRLMSRTTMTDEYMLAVEHFGCTLSELEKLAINGMKSAFAHYDERIRVIFERIKPGYAKLREELAEKRR